MAQFEDFEKALVAHADGENKLNELQSMLNEFDKDMESLSSGALTKYLQEIGKISAKFEDPKNPEFGDFMFKLSMWIYEWKKKDVKANPPEKGDSCSNNVVSAELGS